MYLSKLVINVGDNPDRPRPGRLWLRNLYNVHRRLCMAFPSAEQKSNDPHFLKPFKPKDFWNQDEKSRSERPGFLYRIDSQLEGGVAIIVQSAIEPDWDYAFHNADFLLAPNPDVKIFDPQFTNDQRFRFRLRANPTKRVGDKGDRLYGKRVGVYHEEDQLNWLRRKAAAGGFELIEAGISERRTGNGRKKLKENLRFFSVLFDGSLEVTDAEVFTRTLARGIGPAKAFGFGLLSLARA